MTISIWRYSHLTLAISSFVFILIASLTGIILAFEPISNQLKPYAVKTNEVSVAETLSALQKEYNEVITIDVNQHNFVKASVITKSGKSETFYINPKTGKKIGKITSKPGIYKFATNLHRSLFLKSTGRFLVAFFSFFLLLITISGALLIIKRQGGLIKFFTKVVYEDFEQFYHVTLSRVFLIPIVIITLTGVYLSLDKFSLLPKTNTKHQYELPSSAEQKIKLQEFSIFKNTTLNQLKSLEFPFSKDEEDYFLLKLKDSELLIHQYSGNIISNQQFSWIKILTNWSLYLHTGRGSILWSLVLLSSCIVILFFTYSGFIITLKRKQKNVSIKNKFKKNDAEYIILVGSETGNTFNTAESFYKALLAQHKTVFIDSLNNYVTFDKAKQLIIFTSTYGEGQAPINATKFLNLIRTIPQNQHLQYAIVGFGSLAYPEYCKFAIEIDELLSKKSNFSPILPLTKINNQNFIDFKSWVREFNTQTKLSLSVKQKIDNAIKQQNFEVIDKTQSNIDDTFLIRLRPTKKINFTSGDLLAIIPTIDNVKRLYSIAKIDNDILLSIKKHEFGICSNLLHNLKLGDTISASIEKNKSFHFPKKAKEVILIANGTGIAPYLGMLQNNSTKTHVFCGLRTKASVNIYKPHIENTNINFAFSQEENNTYVQDVIVKQEELVVSVLQHKGVIMICGSVAMMNATLSVLENIIQKHFNASLDKFEKQIKTDCY